MLQIPTYTATSDLLHFADSIRARSILKRYGVLAINNKSQITTETLIDFARYFGRPRNNLDFNIKPSRLHPTHPEVFVNSNLPPYKRMPPAKRPSGHSNSYKYPNQSGWHHDQSFIEKPPVVSILYCKDNVPHGGETLLADNRASWLHIKGTKSGPFLGKQKLRHIKGGMNAIKNKSTLASENNDHTHPLVMTCPYSEEEVLFLGDEVQVEINTVFTAVPHIEDGENFNSIRSLLKFATNHRYVYAHRWEEDDILVFLNFQMMHAATWYDAHKYTRTVYRLVLDI